MNNPKLKVVPGDKPVKADRPIIEIVGREAKTEHLKKPHFEDATYREPVISPFKRRMMELFKPKNS